MYIYIYMLTKGNKHLLRVNIHNKIIYCILLYMCVCIHAYKLMNVYIYIYIYIYYEHHCVTPYVLTSFNPLLRALRSKYGRFSQNFDFHLRRDNQSNFLWASRLWVGRRKERAILGYVPKNYEKNEFVQQRVKRYCIIKSIFIRL